MKLPAAGVQPVQRWRGELVAGLGWLPGDQEAVAAGESEMLTEPCTTLIVCAPCHQLIHDGKPAATCAS